MDSLQLPGLPVDVTSHVKPQETVQSTPWYAKGAYVKKPNSCKSLRGAHGSNASLPAEQPPQKANLFLQFTESDFPAWQAACRRKFPSAVHALHQGHNLSSKLLMESVFAASCFCTNHQLQQGTRKTAHRAGLTLRTSTKTDRTPEEENRLSPCLSSNALNPNSASTGSENMLPKALKWNKCQLPHSSPKKRLAVFYRHPENPERETNLKGNHLKDSTLTKNMCCHPINKSSTFHMQTLPEPP